VLHFGSVNDRELTDAERAEVGRVFESHQAFISKAAALFAPSPESVPDIVQGVALRLCRGGLGSFQGRSKLTTWLFAVTRSVALSERRTDFRQRRKADAFAAEISSEPSYNPYEEDPRQTQIETLNRGIDALPTRHRRVLRNQMNASGVIQDRADNLRGFRAREALRSMLRK
jgi:RNA polymerase sigma-70 factor, ECF subfamily